MAIKAETDAIHFRTHPDERVLAQKLDEAFDITRARIQGGFSFWFAEPKAHVKDRFGLRQEVLVVYSSHSTTDARVLTEIGNVIRLPEFSDRVEKVLFLLIHKGDTEATDELLRSQTDRIVMPIHVTELLDPQRGSVFIRTKIAEKVGSVNLFDMSSPIKSDKYFFGRDDLVQSLISRTVVNHENTGLFGLRKTGKTSVLFAVRRRLVSQPVLCQYLDCQNPGVHAARWWQLLEHIVTQCAATLFRDYRRTAHVHAREDGVYTPANAGLFFASDIKAILSYGALEQLLLILDEVEYITHGLSGALGHHWDEDCIPLWQTIRAVHQETNGEFSFIVAGVNPTSVVQSHFGSTPNPIFQLAVPQYLEPLAVDHVRDMVRTIGRYTGLRFEESVYGYLQEAYGGHPYLIRIACSEVWNTSNVSDPERFTTVSIHSFTSRRAELKARLNGPIKDILLSLIWWYPVEYDLLRILAEDENGANFVSEYMQSQPESIIQFARYGILKDGAGGFAIADLRDFLNEHGAEYQKEISPFRRGDLPPELLPEVPDLRQLGRLFEKRTEIEINLRKAIIFFLSAKHTFDARKISQTMLIGLPRRPERPNPEELFVGRSPQEVIIELYTTDLKAIIIKNWEIFGTLFDGKRSWFEMNMDTLNKARRADAHTRPFTETEANQFHAAYTWLLQHLSKVP